MLYPHIRMRNFYAQGPHTIPNLAFKVNQVVCPWHAAGQAHFPSLNGEAFPLMVRHSSTPVIPIYRLEVVTRAVAARRLL
jgi:hypothetical protein